MDVRKGKDMQGIPWNVMPTTRDKYRQSRLQGYANFENVPNSGRLSEKACHSYAFQISYIPGRVEHLFRPSKHLMWRCWCRNACLQRKANSTTSFSTARGRWNRPSVISRRAMVFSVPCSECLFYLVSSFYIQPPLHATVQTSNLGHIMLIQVTHERG